MTPADNSVGGLLAFVGGDEARRWGDDHEALRRRSWSSSSPSSAPRRRPRGTSSSRTGATRSGAAGDRCTCSARASLTQDREAIWAPIGRLHWAGTETATFWHGYMDGAISSGKRAAAEVLGA